MKFSEMKSLKNNYISLAQAVVDRAIQDTKLKVTLGTNSTEKGVNLIKNDALDFLREFDGSLYDDILQPSAQEREEIKKAVSK